MRRREFLMQTGALLGLSLAGLPNEAVGAATSAFENDKRRILMFTKSSGFEHPAIKRTGDKLGFAEQTLTDLGHQHGFDVTCTKDGTVFTPENIAKYDAFFFYTTGDLTKPGTDNNPPMSPEGKAAFLEAIRKGKGFIGTHSATDSFHHDPDDRYVNFGEQVDPYITMIGAEFIHHDAQQKAKMHVVDTRFPGFDPAGSGFELMEEWYSFKDFRKDLHVLLVQETEGMNGPHYARAPYPATWARKHGKGRVFYTSMGHREDVWTNPIFQSLLLGGINWAVGNVKADVAPNIESVCPKAWLLPAPPPPKPNKP
jgi:type 1 glutamine amidotransferase